MEWYIVKVLTNNGIRIGLDQERPTTGLLGIRITEEEALYRAEELSQELNIEHFNYNSDVFLSFT